MSSTTTTSTTTLLPPTMYSSFPTKAGDLTAVTGPATVPLVSAERNHQTATSPEQQQSALLPGNLSFQMKDIAKEALRLTRETLKAELIEIAPKPEAPRKEEEEVTERPTPTSNQSQSTTTTPIAATGMRLNKFVRRLHDMLQSEKDSGIVEWRRGLLVLHSTDTFQRQVLPKYFNTRNFKTFRRQLNYYGFVHVRSYSTTGQSTTALWVNRDLAETGSDDISSVLLLKRVEPCEATKTAEARRARKELAISTVEEDLGVSAKSLMPQQIRSLAQQRSVAAGKDENVPLEFHPRSNSERITAQGRHAMEVTDTSSDEESGAALLLLLSGRLASYKTHIME